MQTFNQIDNYSVEDTVARQKCLELETIVNLLVSMAGDYIVEPVVEGLTEKFTLNLSMVNLQYQLYSGNEPFTDGILYGNEPTVSAAKAFEGDNITIKIYSNNTLLSTAKLKTVLIGDKKIGKLIPIS